FARRQLAEVRWQCQGSTVCRTELIEELARDDWADRRTPCTQFLDQVDELLGQTALQQVASSTYFDAREHMLSIAADLDELEPGSRKLSDLVGLAEILALFSFHVTRAP